MAQPPALIEAPFAGSSSVFPMFGTGNRRRGRRSERSSYRGGRSAYTTLQQSFIDEPFEARGDTARRMPSAATPIVTDSGVHRVATGASRWPGYGGRMTTTGPNGQLDNPRLVVLEGSFNFRDLGGYETLDGRTVRWRRLFRADGPHALTASDAHVLGELGLETVIDLRTVDETEQRGRYHDSVGAATFHHLPMTDVLPEEAELREWVDAAYVGDHYARIARRGASAIAAAISIMSSPDALPAMFHCSAGKDRTGVLAAIVLGLLGVPDETIVADYSLSRDGMDRMLAWLRERAADPTELERYAPAIRSAEPTAMRVFLAGLRDQYGSFDGYAAALGLAGEVTSIRAAVLE
jgi:protein-tyrosine phosphatase